MWARPLGRMNKSIAKDEMSTSFVIPAYVNYSDRYNVPRRTLVFGESRAHQTPAIGHRRFAFSAAAVSLIPTISSVSSF